MTANPQPGLFVEETALHYHLEFSLLPGVSMSAAVAGISSALQAATTMRGPNAVWGFGPQLWREFAPDAIPADVQPFSGIEGSEGIDAPATQSDIWFWCHGNAYEKVWRTAYDVMNTLASVARVDTQLSAFVGRDNRDTIGFIDGTENPALDEALAVSVIAGDQPGAGGVPVLIQKWVHDLAAFEKLPRVDQEDVIGRTYTESIQLDDTVMPATSHVSRNTITDAQGTELHIYRRNTPFAAMGEIGTLFIGCSADPSRIDTMLNRMFGTAGDDLTDHLTHFSRPITGSYYFAPSMNDLFAVFGPLAPDEDEEILDEQAESEDSLVHTDESANPDAGLSIGSLRSSANRLSDPTD